MSEAARTRIVVLDGHTLNPGDNPWDDLEQLGHLIVHERTPETRVVERAIDAEIVLTNKTRMPAEVIDALPRLRFISVLATGYDIVDVAAARARRIPVSNVPEYGTDSVAQHVFALLLALCHGVAEHNLAVHAGEWSQAKDFCFWQRPPLELAGKTMGIIGLGRIGRRVAALAQAFGMRVVAAGSSAQPPALPPGVEWLTIAKVFATADVVSLHCPLTPATTRMVNADLLRRMKLTAFLINTARGGLIDEAALAHALDAGVLAGAAVDVASAEPIQAHNPLLHTHNCIITPHLAWASLAARQRLMATTVQNVRGFLDGHPIHVVNPA